MRVSVGPGTQARCQRHQHVISAPAPSLPLPRVPGHSSPFLPGPTPHGVSIRMARMRSCRPPPLLGRGGQEAAAFPGSPPTPIITSFLCCHQVPLGTQQAREPLSALLQPVLGEGWAAGLCGGWGDKV